MLASPSDASTSEKIPDVPKIKKISFPSPRVTAPAKIAASVKPKTPADVEVSASASAKARTLVDTKGHTRRFAGEKLPESSFDERRAAKTRFSKSIGAQEPRPPLDSEPEAGDQEAPSVEPPKMAPPEDLPGREHELLAHADGATWNTDTPSAREVWQRARSSWRRASQQAVALGGQGLRAGKMLAESASDKVRERLRQAADERSARAHLQSASEARPLTDLPSEAVAPAHPISSHPNKAGRLILGLARAAGRKAAAPASAALAATVVYFAGSHLLGTDAHIALSKTARGPEVPNLGTLDENDQPKGEEKSAPQSPNGEEAAQSSEKPAQSGPAPMETEVTEMPKGMSWPGKGLIEVVTSQEELVYVDGVFTGRGPLRRIPVSPGEHEVSIRMDGKERKGSVKVLADKNTRAVFKGP